MQNSTSSQKLGKVMTFVAWILVILLLTLFFNNWSKEYQLNTKPALIDMNGQKETIIKRNINNQYIVEGTLNHEPVLFLLDTGATNVVISEALADKLHLNRTFKGVAQTAGGEVPIYGTKVEEIIIGNISLKNISAIINPKIPNDKVLLGMSALKRIKLLQTNDQLILSIE